MNKIKVVRAQSGTPKKVYRTPVLSSYGDVRTLTKKTGVLADGFMSTKSCWIAEALYGLDAPRVVLVRAWLAQCYDQRVWWAVVLVPLYRRFGERTAAAIQVFPFLRRLFRPIFDRAVLHAYRAYAEMAVIHGGRA